MWAVDIDVDKCKDINVGKVIPIFKGFNSSQNTGIIHRTFKVFTVG